MKKILCGLVAIGFAQLAFAGNYLLTLDGKTYDIDLGEQKTLQTKKGDVQVSLQKKAVATFTIDKVSFDYPSDLSPSVSRLDKGINQVLLAEGSGDVFLLQVYEGLDGSRLVPMMENEMTKEEVSIGYKKTGKDIELKLDNGEVLKGRFVKTENKSDTYDRYIVGCSTEFGGVIAIVVTSDLEIEGQDKSRMMNALKSLKAKCEKE